MTTQFDIFRRPLVTEKTNYQISKLHQYVFEVDERCNPFPGERCRGKDLRSHSRACEYYQYRGQTQPPCPQPPLDGTRQRYEESDHHLGT